METEGGDGRRKIRRLAIAAPPSPLPPSVQSEPSPQRVPSMPLLPSNVQRGLANIHRNNLVKADTLRFLQKSIDWKGLLVVSIYAARAWAPVGQDRMKGDVFACQVAVLDGEGRRVGGGEMRPPLPFTRWKRCSGAVLSMDLRDAAANGQVYHHAIRDIRAILKDRPLLVKSHQNDLKWLGIEPNHSSAVIDLDYLIRRADGSTMALVDMVGKYMQQGLRVDGVHGAWKDAHDTLGVFKAITRDKYICT